MIDTKELFKNLEEQQAKEKRKKVGELVKMTLRDLRNLIKMAKNSGMDLTKVTLNEVLKSFRG